MPVVSLFEIVDFFYPFFGQVLGCRVLKHLSFMYEAGSFSRLRGSWSNSCLEEGYMRTFRFYFAKPEHATLLQKPCISPKRSKFNTSRYLDPEKM